VVGKLFGALLVLGEGALVGTALVAFLTVLDVVPRVAQATNTTRYVHLYERAVLVGALTGSLTDILPAAALPVATASGVGFITGLFTGLFTAALAEVLNVIPVFGRRFNMERSIVILVVALAVGKTVGSLVYWLLPQLRP
jgi:stage V sporulation protein AB